MSTASTPIALTIAGSDSGGGAGIQADLKTFTALGVYGASAITALTAQNTQGVAAVHMVPAAFVAQQIEVVLADLDVAAVKTGMLGTAEIVIEVARVLAGRRNLAIVVDPVMVATSGDPLLAADAVAAVRERLIPLAELITPNLPEAARLLDKPVAASLQECEAQAVALRALGCGAALLKGGHGTGSDAVDVLYDGVRLRHFSRPRIATRNTHGTGCTLSAAIAAGRAKGLPLTQAIVQAKEFLWQALRQADRLTVGSGHGPVHHGYAIRPPGLSVVDD
jgi:hydroxymethylpyrimidine/phosphomethylpyrimidine kinase